MATSLQLAQACGGRSYHFHDWGAPRHGGSMARILTLAAASVCACRASTEVWASPGLAVLGEPASGLVG